jgi:hypothetical protein
LVTHPRQRFMLPNISKRIYEFRGDILLISDFNFKLI